MIHKDEIAALESRAHAALVTMREVCSASGVFPQSWYRAKKRGSMEYVFYKKLLAGLSRLENSEEEK